MRGPDHPAFAHVRLLRRVNVDEVPSVDHEFIDVLGLVLEEGPQRLGGTCSRVRLLPGVRCCTCCSSSEDACSTLSGHSDQYYFPLCNVLFNGTSAEKEEDTTAFAVCVKISTWFS